MTAAPLETTPLVLKTGQGDLTLVAGLLGRGDSALTRGDVVEAISQYRQAVNGAPLNATPRLKLAQAYLQGGMRDKALSEAQRALVLAPDNKGLQDFLAQMDTDDGTYEGAIARYRALIERDANNGAAHLGLGDAYWNSGALDQAEAEYKTAQRLAATGDTAPAAHLARLYAAQARYTDSLAMLQASGPEGYRLALRIVQNQADTLSSTLEASQEAFDAGRTSINCRISTAFRRRN
jgi:tetratricopeptide (TPR) repeat protein